MIWELISGFQEGDGAKLPRVTQILIPRKMLTNTVRCVKLAIEDEAVAREG